MSDPTRRSRLEAIAAEIERRKNKKLQSNPDGGLMEFVRYFWDVLEPNTEFVYGWPLEAVCKHLEAVSRGEITKLLINVPPGFMKSLLTDVFWPAWEWGPQGKPYLRYVAFSYSAGLTERDNSKFRDLILSKKYKDLWGDVFEAKKIGEVKITNSRTGSKLATSVGGIGTGERGDRIICFPYEELVATEQGPLPIGHVVENKLKIKAWSYNHKTNTFELQPIIGWHKNPSRELIKLTFEDGSCVTSTKDHKFLTNEGYKEAQSLFVGNSLLSAPSRMLVSSSSITVPQIQIEMGPNLFSTDTSYCAHTNTKFFAKNFSSIVMSCRNLTNNFFSQMRYTISKSSMFFAICNVLSSCSVFKVFKSTIRSISVFMSNFMSHWNRAYKSFCNKLMAKTINGFSIISQSYSGISFIKDWSHNFSWNSQNMTVSNCCSWKAFDTTKIRNQINVCKTNNIFPNFNRIVSIEHIKDLPSSTYCITVENNHNLLCGTLANIIASNCDDPHNIKDGESDVIRSETTRWFREALSNRLNDMEKSAIVVIMQRVHEADVSGVILSEIEGYEHLMIPMEYDPGRICQTSIGWEDPREEEGELAWPERFPPEVVDNMRSTLGPYAYAGQYQQCPTPRGGGIFKREWWNLWNDPFDAYPPLEFVLVSVDTAYTKKEENDPSACTVWGLFRENGAPRIMLLYAWRKHLELHGKYEPRSDSETNEDFRRRTQPLWGLIEWIAYTCRRYKADRLIIEGKASGLSVAQEIQRLYGYEGWGVEIVQPQADKVARAHAVQPIFSQLLVYAPDRDWADMVIDEMSTFPKGRYKDLTDSTTQAMKFLRDSNMIVHRHELEAEFEEGRKYRGKLQPLYPV